MLLRTSLAGVMQAVEKDSGIFIGNSFLGEPRGYGLATLRVTGDVAIWAAGNSLIIARQVMENRTRIVMRPADVAEHPDVDARSTLLHLWSCWDELELVASTEDGEIDELAQEPVSETEPVPLTTLQAAADEFLGWLDKSEKSKGPPMSSAERQPHPDDAKKLATIEAMWRNGSKDREIGPHVGLSPAGVKYNRTQHGWVDQKRRRRR